MTDTLADTINSMHDVVRDVLRHLATECDHARLSQDCNVYSVRIEALGAIDEYEAWRDAGHLLAATLSDALALRLQPYAELEADTCPFCCDLSCNAIEALVDFDHYLGRS
jgi:hypothetical protein